MKPLFEVGEEVIVCSEAYPESNGDATVCEVITSNSRKLEWLQLKNPMFRVTFGNPELPVYVLNRMEAEIDLDGDLIYAPWGESSLRKKHKGSGSFDSLIKKLNSPVKA